MEDLKIGLTDAPHNVEHGDNPLVVEVLVDATEYNLVTIDEESAQDPIFKDLMQDSTNMPLGQWMNSPQSPLHPFAGADPTEDAIEGVNTLCVSKEIISTILSRIDLEIECSKMKEEAELLRNKEVPHHLINFMVGCLLNQTSATSGTKKCGEKDGKTLMTEFA